MPIIDQSTYNAPAFLRNGHIQTVYPFVFRKVQGVEFKRERVETFDNDFIDVDIYRKDESNNKIAILTHGLEGSTDNQYIKGIAKYLSTRGFDIAAWNMRSCSGEMNKGLGFYHAAMTDDLEAVIQHAKKIKPYKEILLVGYSLGSNLTAIYLGKHGNQVHSEVTAGCLVSCPTSLKHSIDQLQKRSHKIYMESFLMTMRKKVALKQSMYKEFNIDIKKAIKAKNFNEFDQIITAPLFGFKDPFHYYHEASCLNYLSGIKVPTLILNAKDDPFLPKKCFPLREAKNNPSLYLEITRSGGHLGFLKSLNMSKETYAEERIYSFYSEVSGI